MSEHGPQGGGLHSVSGMLNLAQIAKFPVQTRENTELAVPCTWDNCLQLFDTHSFLSCLFREAYSYVWAGIWERRAGSAGQYPLARYPPRTPLICSHLSEALLKPKRLRKSQWEFRHAWLQQDVCTNSQRENLGTVSKNTGHSCELSLQGSLTCRLSP